MPNPRRVAAGKLNQLKWKGVTPAGREKLRQTAIKHQPWLHSTGPRTAKGKARVALNGCKRQKGPRSMRAIARELHDLRELLGEMEAARAAAGLGKLSALA